MKKQGWGSLAVLALGLAACSSGSSNSPTSVTVDCSDGQQVAGIIAGTNLNINSHFARETVLLAQHIDATKMALCTGTIIDNDMILTAAHCVGEAKSDSDVEVLFTANEVCDAHNNTLQKRTAKALGFHKDYNPHALTDDLALVQFEGGLPEGREIVQLADHVDMLPNESVLVIGFGKTQGYKVDEDNKFRLRFGWVTPMTEERMNSEMKSYASVENLDMTDTRNKKRLFFDQSNGNGVCAGDSGGPAFEKQRDRWVQIGVASFVNNPGKEESCAYSSAHTNVTLYRDWIESAKLKLRNRR